METITICFLLYFISHCSCTRLQEATINTFNVMNYGAIGDGRKDDSQSFLKAWSKVCSTKNTIATLKVPPGKTFMLSPLQFSGPCYFSSVHFQLEGKIVAPNNKEAWKGKDEDFQTWIQFSNVNGLIINGGGQIDGGGYVWWNSCKGESCGRPTALHIHKCNNFQLHDTHHLNSAKNHISINSSNNTHIFNVTITAPQDSPNTDGIDISQSSHILIQHSTIATGDDCIAINTHTSNINITGVTCGPGHGISIGSLGEKGSYGIVEQVHVSHCSFKGAKNGMRIKTWQGGFGYVRNILFEHILLTNTGNPIIIDQDYEGVNEEEKKQESAIHISGVTYRDVQGTSISEIAINLNCGEGAGCNNIFMDAINIISASSGSKVRASCNNAHGIAASTSPHISCLS
ncbi:hypothetical protein VNO78_04938 [Psophocarpus tetragonolobus]|uniref:Polygalacturonase n=1 Tax=Psophocarpus tetragonolobus TaxID=3891 RepID=A0AAN9XQH4_PSOTE